MSELPATLTYFGNLQSISQVLNKCALPLVEASQLHNPFLPDKNTPLAFTVSEMFEQSVKFISHAILGKSAPRGQPNHPLIKAIARWRLENRFNDESEIREALNGLLPAMVEKTFNDAKVAHQRWIDFVSQKRIVVLYEKFQELQQWERLIYQHKGAAIKFKCATDDIFKFAHPAIYQKKPMQTVELSDYIEHMVGTKTEIEFNPLNILLAQNYSQRTFKEWRMVVNSDDYTENLIEFPVGAIQSVYIDALVPAQSVEQLKNHLAKMNSHIHVYQAKCKRNEYELEFVKISDNHDEPPE
ncbi:hypothetical protein [Aliikangiella maris]|uniref:DUF2971 domain-containing protein n=2 Tax=Aliikangiella maris TaxID=3162458 RepID=A0ABV3MRL0_9GAMM